MKKIVVTSIAACLLAAAAAAAPVEWVFPRQTHCHEGLAFADGVTGVLVWGGGDTLKLTIGRGDLWEHRGGYPWTAEQSYSNIVAAVAADDGNRLRGLFRKETPPGEPRNPFLLSLGRVVVRLPGLTLTAGTLDPKTGLGTLTFTRGGETLHAELAMAKSPRAFALKLPAGVDAAVDVQSAFSFPRVRKELEPIGYGPVERLAPRKTLEGGFCWKLPADPAVTLRWERRGDSLLVGTSRGTEPVVFPQGCTFETVRAASLAHWSAFWREGATVRLPDAVLQRMFDYGMYRFGAMTDPDGVPAGLQGAWLEDDKLVPWNGDYHFNINVQECYSPAYRGGHFRHLMPLFRMVLSWRERLADNARKFADVDGYVLPHSVDDRGTCIGGFWTGTIDHASTAWIASMMYRYVRYSGDTAFLKAGAYDFMKGALRVYRAMMEERGGRLSIPVAPSPEWNGAAVRAAVGRDPSFQLAAAHRLARDLIDAATRLGETPDPMWGDMVRRLPPYTADGSGILLFAGQRLTESHRHHSHLAGLYPFNTIDLSDRAARKVAEDSFRTWVSRGTGYWTGWCVPWASILHTHMGHSAAAVNLLHAWNDYFCDDGYGSHHDAVHPGFTAFTGRPSIMQMDGACAAVTAIMELLVHEVNGRTEFFRGCPSVWKDVSFEKIRLSDGRRVSGRRLNGRVKVEYAD